MVRMRTVSALVVFSVLALALPGSSLAQGGGLPVPPGRLVAGDDNGLFTMLADGSEKTYLAEEAEADCWLRDGTWSPDGRQIMYTSICGGSSPTDWRPDPEREDLRERTASVMVFDVESGTSSELVPGDGIHQDYAGAWYPSGRQIVFYSDRDPSATFNLFTLDIATGDVVQLTTLDSNASRVSIDPSGRYLLYNRRIVEADSIHFEVRALDIGNLSEIPVARGFTPNWSPDGRWIAFATEDGAADIYIMPADCIYSGGGCDAAATARNVTHSPDSSEREPVFSPDQTQIAYVRDTDPDPNAVSWDIFRQEIRTGRRQNLTNTPGVDERHRSWEPVETAERAAIENVLPVVVRVSTGAGAANLRAEPSTSADIMGQVTPGQLLFVQGASENRSWYRITIPEDGAEAWIFGNLIAAIEGELGSVPVVE